MKNKNPGFTLIELLVVIAIIGVLSSIVLASLTNSRNKALDAAISADLSHLRASAELVYNALGSSYGNQIFITNCGTVAVATPTSQVFNDAAVQKGIDDAVSKNGGSDAKCAAGVTYYVLAVQLKSSTANAWCIDNLGNSKKITWSTFASGDTNCNEAGS